MTTLEVPFCLLEETFEIFRYCGRGRKECVVYWTGPIDRPAAVDRVEHPKHVARLGGYEVSSDWVTTFFLAARRERRAARVQVHTHPGPAFHSITDDCYPLVPASGFLSLVIPNFAEASVSLDAAHLVEFGSNGEWVERAPATVLALL